MSFEASLCSNCAFGCKALCCVKCDNQTYDFNRVPAVFCPYCAVAPRMDKCVKCSNMTGSRAYPPTCAGAAEKMNKMSPCV